MCTMLQNIQSKEVKFEKVHTTTVSTFGDLDSFCASACSLPPSPKTISLSLGPFSTEFIVAVVEVEYVVVWQWWW
jgi:hypothetical protein